MPLNIPEAVNCWVAASDADFGTDQDFVGSEQ